MNHAVTVSRLDRVQDLRIWCSRSRCGRTHHEGYVLGLAPAGAAKSRKLFPQLKSYICAAAISERMRTGGSADVAALIAQEYRWAYTSVGRLVRATFGGGYNPYGGLFEHPLSPAGRSFQRNCQLIGGILLDPV